MSQEMVTKEMFKSAFMAAVDGIQEGSMEKEAKAFDTMIRRKLREDAISPAILPYVDVTRDDLAYYDKGEDLFIICEMEPDQAAPSTTTFEDTPETWDYEAQKFRLTFHANITPEWTKNVDRLMAYRMDLRELVVDNSLRDLSRQKDIMFFRDVDEICGPKPGAISNYGMEQHVVYGDAVTRESVVNAAQIIPDRQLLLGVCVVNRRTFSQFAKWNRTEMGGDFAQELIRKGLRAFEKAEIYGTDYIVTAKHDIINNGVMYQFTTPNYLGRAGVLQQPTMYVKKEKDILRFSCVEKIGHVIANVAGVQKVTFGRLAGYVTKDGRLSPADAASFLNSTNTNGLSIAEVEKLNQGSQGSQDTPEQEDPETT